MTSSIIFENNITSEVLLKSFFLKSKIHILKSFNKKVDVLMYVERYEPDFIVIDYDLYKFSIYDIIDTVKEVLPDSKVIITAKKMSKSEEKRLRSHGVSDVFIKPFIDTRFIRALT